MTPEPGTPMVPLSVADAARDVSPGCAYTWAELEGAAVPWPASPATRDVETLRNALHEIEAALFHGQPGLPEHPSSPERIRLVHNALARVAEARFVGRNPYALAAPPATRDDRCEGCGTVRINPDPHECQVCGKCLAPAARYDGHPAEPPSEALPAEGDDSLRVTLAKALRILRKYSAGTVNDHAAALRAAATPTTPAGHVPVPIDDLREVLDIHERWLPEPDPPGSGSPAYKRLRQTLADAQQDANHE